MRTIHQVLVVTFAKVGTFVVTLENCIATTQWTLWNIKAMPYFRETSISFFWVCGYNKLNRFNEGNLDFADACYIQFHKSFHSDCKVHIYWVIAYNSNIETNQFTIIISMWPIIIQNLSVYNITTELYRVSNSTKDCCSYELTALENNECYLPHIIPPLCVVEIYCSCCLNLFSMLQDYLSAAWQFIGTIKCHFGKNYLNYNTIDSVVKWWS